MFCSFTLALGRSICAVRNMAVFVVHYYYYYYYHHHHHHHHHYDGDHHRRRHFEKTIIPLCFDY
jgi:hypothetical protein